MAIAAILHDIRRLDSKGDPSHGERSASWFLKNIEKIKDQFGGNPSRSDAEEIYQTIYYHEIPYEKDIMAEPNYKKYKDAIDVLKTADALDRYRLPKFKWWINDQYLVLIPPKKLKKFAYELVVASETIFLKKNNNIEGVFKALERLQK